MSIVPAGMFRYNFGGDALPEYEASWDSYSLMKFAVEQIANGVAYVTEQPVQNISPLRISLPVYGFDNAASPLVVASALPIAQARLEEIQGGFIVIDKDRLFRSM
ncbi:unnamed protein product [Penicillium bialowiezense]